MQDLLIGTAGWSVSRSNLRFSSEGSALERYASVLPAAEINSSFYRRHKGATWERWRDAVPHEFQFSVKVPKVITHELRLADVTAELEEFFADVELLGHKLGAVLVQLPPNFAFEHERVGPFLRAVRHRSDMPIFVEPRHLSWADQDACDLLERYRVGRVYADPQLPELRAAALANGTSYLRLHGSPKIYYSAYSDERIAQIAEMIRPARKPCWCIFDNTASGAALDDALKLLDLLART